MQSWWLYQNEVWLRPLKRLLALTAVVGAGWMMTVVAIELKARYGKPEARGAGALQTASTTPPDLLSDKPRRIRNQAALPLEFDGKARDTLPPPPLSMADRMCLARAVYHEARGEPIEGQIAVAQVVMNRLRAKRWPKTVCGVVYEGQARGEKCQFSFACYGRKELPDSNQLWAQAKWISDDVAAGRVMIEDLSQATYYHTDKVRPVWRATLTPIRRVGQHIFYSDPKEAVPQYVPPAADQTVAAAPAETPAHAGTENGVSAASEVLSASMAAPQPLPVVVPLPRAAKAGAAVREKRVVLQDAADDPAPRRPLIAAGPGQASAGTGLAVRPSAASVVERDTNLSGR
jgi:spore germination cell wall hydrolase CwlJ-like protein